MGSLKYAVSKQVFLFEMSLQKALYVLIKYQKKITYLEMPIQVYKEWKTYCLKNSLFIQGMLNLF
jgi:hypothetical protein